jgi:hypothetical protein
MVGKGALPTSMERGAVSQPFLYNYLSPNMITNEDRELQEDEMNHVLIGTIEERKWWPLSPRGHRRRTMSGTG